MPITASDTSLLFGTVQAKPLEAGDVFKQKRQLRAEQLAEENLKVRKAEFQQRQQQAEAREFSDTLDDKEQVVAATVAGPLQDAARKDYFTFALRGNPEALAALEANAVSDEEIAGDFKHLQKLGDAVDKAKTATQKQQATAVFNRAFAMTQERYSRAGSGVSPTELTGVGTRAEGFQADVEADRTVRTSRETAQAQAGVEFGAKGRLQDVEDERELAALRNALAGGRVAAQDQNAAFAALANENGAAAADINAATAKRVESVELTGDVNVDDVTNRALQKQLFESKQVQDLAISSVIAFQPEFLELKGKLATFVTAGADVVGADAPAKLKKLAAERKDWFTKAENNFLAIRKKITGVAGGKEEMEAIRVANPSGEGTTTEFLSAGLALIATEENIQRGLLKFQLLNGREPTKLEGQDLIRANMISTRREAPLRIRVLAPELMQEDEIREVAARMQSDPNWWGSLHENIKDRLEEASERIAREKRRSGNGG